MLVHWFFLYYSAIVIEILKMCCYHYCVVIKCRSAEVRELHEKLMEFEVSFYSPPSKLAWRMYVLPILIYLFLMTS